MRLSALLALAVLLLPAMVFAQASRPAAASQAVVLPTSAEQLAELGVNSLAAGDPNTAIKAFSKLVEIQPNNVFALLSLADAYLQVRNPLLAVETYNRCQKLSPNDWRVDYGLGTIYLQQNYFRLARPFLERAVSLAPAQASGRGKVAYSLALCFRGLHDMPTAIDWARKTLAMDPTNTEARRLLIALYGEAGRADDALAEIRAALDTVRGTLAKTPDDRAAIEQLLQVLSMSTDMLQKMTTQRPDDVSLRLQLADAMEQLSLAGTQMACHGALEQVDAALKKAPNNAEVLFAHGRLQYLIGRPAQAAEDLRAALKIAPGDPRAKELLQKIDAQIAKSVDN